MAGVGNVDLSAVANSSTTTAASNADLNESGVVSQTETAIPSNSSDCSSETPSISTSTNGLYNISLW